MLVCVERDVIVVNTQTKRHRPQDGQAQKGALSLCFYFGVTRLGACFPCMGERRPVRVQYNAPASHRASAAAAADDDNASDDERRPVLTYVSLVGSTTQHTLSSSPSPNISLSLLIDPIHPPPSTSIHPTTHATTAMSVDYHTPLQQAKRPLLSQSTPGAKTESVASPPSAAQFPLSVGGGPALPSTRDNAQIE